MNILIFGAGALGQALGCMLTQSGHRVDLIIRKRFIGTIREKGLRVTGLFGEFRADLGKLGLLENIDRVTDPGYEALLITTKSYDTAAAVRAIADLKSYQGPVVSMQNGCGNVEQLASCFGSERAYGARVITGFEISGPGEVNITVSADAVHIGSSIRGSMPPFVRQLAAAIDRAGLPCIGVEDIYQDLFAKLLYNCALNPLGAILGVHYGALGESAATREIMDQVIDECFTVIHGIGGTTPWPDAASYRKIFYEKLLPMTYNHRPSMLQDLEQGKQTEIKSLAGWVEMQGKRLTIATPTCSLLTKMVGFLEHKGTSRPGEAET